MINEKVEEFRNAEGAILLDVREPGEFAEGHIPGAVNHPLSEIDQIGAVFKDKDQKFYIYCRSGRRSDEAIRFMGVMGFTNLENIGGIKEYTGTLEA